MAQEAYQEWIARQNARDVAQEKAISAALNKLEAMAADNAKFTLWATNDFGFGSTMKGQLESVMVGEYAQYRNALRLVFRPYRKHRSVQVWIRPYQDAFIWEGYIEVNTNIFTEFRKEASGCSVAQSRYSAFSDKWANEAQESVDQVPVFAQKGRF